MATWSTPPAGNFHLDLWVSLGGPHLWFLRRCESAEWPAVMGMIMKTGNWKTSEQLYAFCVKETSFFFGMNWAWKCSGVHKAVHNIRSLHYSKTKLSKVPVFVAKCTKTTSFDVIVVVRLEVVGKVFDVLIMDDSFLFPLAARSKEKCSSVERPGKCM